MPLGGGTAGNSGVGHRQRAPQQPLTLQQQLQQAQAALQLLRAQQQHGKLDMEKARQLLQSVKAFVALTALESLQDPNLVKAVALIGRECFEIAAFCAVMEMQQLRESRGQDVGGLEDEEEDAVEGDEFERYMMMLLPYYTDYAALLPPSKHQSELLCLHLLHYLASNRIGEFHMALQTLPPEVRADPMTQQVLQLEKHLIDGSYGELLRPPQQQRQMEENRGKTNAGRAGGESQKRDSTVAALALPPSAQVFIDRLVRTVRLKVAACMEKAHGSVDAAYAMQALGLNTAAELQQFVSARNSSGTQQQDMLLDYLPPPLSAEVAAQRYAAAGTALPTSVPGGAATEGHGPSEANAEAGRVLAAGVGSTSFASAASFTMAPEPRVMWQLDEGIITFVKKGDAATQAQKQHCSLQAMQLVGNLISK